jgi:LPXTG-motif cell wall-anchored protein
MDTASQFILNNPLDEWSAVALNKAGKTVPANYLENVKQDIVSKKGKFHFITDPERYTLGVLAAGADPTNIAGYNLVQSIYNGDVTSQGINGVIYALIALDSGKFDIPSSALWTREKLVNEILKDQNPDGHWSLSSSADRSDADITAMALTALAPYKGQTDVDNSIKSAITYLSKTYQSTTVNSQTAAQIIIALSALGKYDASTQLFEKNGASLMSYLLSFQNNDGGFALNSGEASDVMATQQGLMAVSAYQLYKNGKGSLYQLPKTPQVKTAAVKETSSQQGKTLPNTATNSVNIVLAGLLLILAGTALLYFTRKRKA